MAHVNATLLHPPQIKYRQRHNPFTPNSVGQNDTRLGRWNLRDRRYCVTNHPNARHSMWTFLQLTRQPINNGRNRPTTPQASTPDALHAWFNSVRQELQLYGITSQGFEFGDAGYGNHQLPVSNQRTALDVATDEANLAARIQLLRASVPQDRRLDLVFVLLPQREVPLYALVKRVGDQSAGIRTICHVNRIRGPRNHQIAVPDTNRNLLGNLSMKFNLKINPQGANQAFMRLADIPILDDDTMLMGADVTHPGVGAMHGAPSVAAVVGSIDGNFSQFPASLRENARQQPNPGQQFGLVSERILNLTRMVEERVRLYRTHRNKFPRKLIFYRDGLSEAQLDMCRIHELPDIRQGITRAKDGNNSIPDPEVLLICTIKRHHARFFRETNDTQNRHLFDHNNNPLPGCLIDNTVTHGQNEDFFLYSHEALQGTAKPTHYMVLENDNDEHLTEIASMVSPIFLP